MGKSVISSVKCIGPLFGIPKMMDCTQFGGEGCLKKYGFYTSENVDNYNNNKCM